MEGRVSPWRAEFNVRWHPVRTSIVQLRNADILKNGKHEIFYFCKDFFFWARGVKKCTSGQRVRMLATAGPWPTQSGAKDPKWQVSTKGGCPEKKSEWKTTRFFFWATPFRDYLPFGIFGAGLGGRAGPATPPGPIALGQLA